MTPGRNHAPSRTRRRLGLGACIVALVTGCVQDSPIPSAAPTTPPSAPATSTPSDAPAATESRPTTDAVPNGVVAAVDGGLDGGMLFIVWEGTKERIDQPAPFDDATVDELGLRLEQPVDRLTAGAEPDPRTFWVLYPADSPDARLHLAIADRLYPIQTLAVDREQIDRLPDAEDMLLNRMRPATL